MEIRGRVGGEFYSRLYNSGEKGVFCGRTVCYGKRLHSAGFCAVLYSAAHWSGGIIMVVAVYSASAVDGVENI